MLDYIPVYTKVHESMGGEDEFIDVENATVRPGVSRTAMTVDGRVGGADGEEEIPLPPLPLMGTNESQSVGKVRAEFNRVYSGIILKHREVI